MKDYNILGINVRGLIAVLIGFIFFLISFRAPGINHTALDYSVPPMVAAVQNYSLVVVVLLLALIITLFVAKNKKFVPRYFSSAILNFFIFQEILAFTDLYYDGDIVQFLVATIFNLFLLFSFGYVVKDLYSEPERLHHFFHMMFIGIFGFIVVNVILYVGDFANVVWKGRFFGATSQPNFIGMCGGSCAVFALALMLNAADKTRRTLYIAGLILGLLVCFWSGSRSSLISCLAGISLIVFLAVRKGRHRFVIVAIMIFLSALIFTFFDASSLDYTDRGNTRENTWKELADVAFQLPIVGVGSKQIATTNSYLYSIAATGLIGSFFFFRSLLKVIQRFRRGEGSIFRFGQTGKFIFAGLACFLFCGAVFEGFLLDSASIPVFIFWVLASFGR
ncbi:O-antigen ligase family protein [Dyadobacter bucti]|uniref:O-antigen ligase family protein n=1 Tax=Dyadobacter bucti TaxID=2572203 RepID=UPI003F70BD4F